MKVRKIFLKPLAVFMAFCMMCSMPIVVNANEYDFHYYEMDITVSGYIDIQTAELVAQMMNGEMFITPYSLCNHNMVHVAMAWGINHRQYATSPKCHEVSYKVYQCTKCTYLDLIKMGERRIYCCS